LAEGLECRETGRGVGSDGFLNLSHLEKFLVSDYLRHGQVDLWNVISLPFSSDLNWRDRLKN